ncbi:cobalt transporter CbiM [Patescibacteria group bacterium]|nr:cobalt transporter CbiM [Patescibacteria group bacterium]MCL5797225.1 cobalt transporter CbiM [Patescibacteria group bacterium]
MHIPDGYLSPTTSFTLYTVCTPFLMKASREAKKKLDSKTIPLISLFSALSFLIMMFNVPLPGGTTGHAVGTVISSIILGPWIGMLTTTVALIIQALFFGDGGILTLGANIFNMAIVMALAGYAIFRFLAGWKKETGWKIVSAAVAGYIAINLAALLAAVELGIQPIIFRSITGQPLYFPYGLTVSIPAMMLGHLTLAGLAEAFVTGLTLSWIYRTNPSLITPDKKVAKSGRFFPLAIVIIFLLILLTPLGLLTPGTAWGEWSRQQLSELGLGYIPAGFDRWTGLWSAPFSGYNFSVLGNSFLGYLFSGFLGVFIVVSVVYLLFKVFKLKNK